MHNDSLDTEKLRNGQPISFPQTRYLVYIRQLGCGGTGSTHLFHDPQFDIDCVIKKFNPIAENRGLDCYERFKQEAIILFNISHPHIVRVFNCFLYPENHCGYIQMEYINGVQINQFHPNENTKNWNEIFIDTIDAFVALEKQGILHRDIRPENFLITPEGEIKIIDFGFGKQWHSETTLQNNSLILNWPGTMPNELKIKSYDCATEVYYVGKLFEGLTEDDGIFGFTNVLRKMTYQDQKMRLESFISVQQEIDNTDLVISEFTNSDKLTYQKFADALISIIATFKNTPVIITDTQEIMQNIAGVIEVSVLENKLQDTSLLINCFTKTAYSYYPKQRIPVSIITDFYELLKKSNDRQKDLIIRNLSVRLNRIECEIPSVYDEDIPF